MKRTITLILLFFVCIFTYAQPPQSINYQTVIRDSNGDVISNQSVSIRLSILQTSLSGSAVYVETHSVTSNGFGLVNLEIGGGTIQSGTFSAINWGGDDFFLKVELDVSGGTSYTSFGISQLLSVPYALHANTASNVDDADADASNELQNLSLTGNILALSNGGGTVTLPSSGVGDNWGTQVTMTDATLTGDGTASLPLGIAQQSASAGQLLGWNGSSWSPQSEGQTLILGGNNLSISGGNTIALPTSSLWNTNSSDIFFNTGNVGIGLNAPQTYLHIQDNAGMALPQVQLENTLNQGNTSIGFFNPNIPVNYSMGLDNALAEFKITAAPQLLPATQNDGVTLYRSVPIGITSFNNQSRSRVYQAQGQLPQMIPAGVWQPIEFDQKAYDTHGEFMTSPVGSNPPGTPGAPIPLGTSVFMALEEGYYQVNARTDFMMEFSDLPATYVNLNGYVSIAIFLSNGGAPANMYAQGNKLQGLGFYFNTQTGEEMTFEFPNNLAPNVSDVIYLQPGDIVEIRVYQDILPLIPLMQGTSQTYVSIHKIS